MIELRKDAVPSLYPHQLNAVRSWENAGGKGILRMVTGSGKTLAALACIELASKSDDKLQVHIIVPTVALLHQWEKELLKKTNIARDRIGLFYGAGLNWGQHTHLSMVEYWRWWVVHLWVEGFFASSAESVGR